ncbi:MAG: hypothetical protein V3V57_10795 [Spirochaetia bacterium]
MKRLILSVILIMAAAALAVGQANTVVITNAENAVFHYVLDPPELTAFDASASIFQNVVYDYFAEVPAAEDDFAGFTELASGQTLRFENLSEGRHLLVGFFVMPGEREFPVRVIGLQVGGGLDERTYQIFSEPSFIVARAGRGRIAAYPPISPSAVASVQEVTGVQEPAVAQSPAERGFFRFQIDNQYEDWAAIPTFLSFPADHTLPSFTREQYGGKFEVLPISQSRRWPTGGSALNEIKVVDNLQAIYLYLSTHSALSADLSVFLYFHNDRNLRRLGAENQFTLELAPSRAEEPGLVVLWEKDRKPVVVGKLASGSFFLEARIEKELLFDLLYARPEITFFDLTTSFFDRQELTYEEFYIATVALAEIPTEKTIY